MLSCIILVSEMIGKKSRKIYINDTKHNFRKKYLLVFISIILTFSLFLLLWSNDLKIESKSASLSFGWLWHSNKSTLVEQMAQDVITGSVISIPVDGLVDNMMRIEDDFCINPHKFKYILNPKSMICDSKRFTLFLFLIFLFNSIFNYLFGKLLQLGDFQLNVIICFWCFYTLRDLHLMGLTKLAGSSIILAIIGG